MRNYILSFGILSTLLFLFGCNKEEQNLRDYYLSQERDERLLGTWLALDESEDSMRYEKDGYTYRDSQLNSGKTLSTRYDCWYTEKDSILRTYYFSGSHFYGSIEYEPLYYRIDNDVLYTKKDTSSEFKASYTRMK